MEITIQHEQDENMFVATTENNERAGMLSYVVVDNHTISVNHTVVPSEFSGKGIAKKLLESCVEYATKQKIKILSTCSFVSSQFERNPDKYRDVIK